MTPVPGYKCVLLGDASVGKSSLVTRLTQNKFSDYAEATVGAAFAAQTITLQDNTQVKFEIWDTAGQERFRSLAPMYYRGATCAIVVFDVTNKNTFERAKEWVKELQDNVELPEYLVIALCANKLDLPNNECGDLPIQYAEQESLLYAETSAKTGLGVKHLFEELARTVPDLAAKREIAKRERTSQKRDKIDLSRIDDSPEKKSGTCC